MGFKVDVKELTDYKQDIDRSSSTVKEQIDGAISSMRAIPSSQSMDGKVGQAVGETITANHIPSLIGLKSSYDQLSKAVTKTLSDFKSATGETSDSAIITEDVLKEIPSKLDTLLNNYNEGTDAIEGIYASISDLVSLSLPKSNLEQTINKAKEQVKQIQEKVTTFDGGAKNDEIGTLLSQIDSQIGRITATKSLSYGNSDFLAFSNRNNFVSTMAQAEATMNKEEKIKAEKLRKQKEADWNRLGPYGYYLKYPEDYSKMKSDYIKMIIETSNSAIGSGHTYGSAIMQGLNITGHKMKVDGLNLGSRSISTNEMSRIGKRARTLESIGEDLIDATNKAGRSKIWKGLGGLGTGLGVAFDYNNQMEKYGDSKRAIKNTTAHTIIEAGGAAVGSQIGIYLGTAIPIPVVGTVLGAAAGAMIGAGISSAYDWIESGNAKKTFNKISQGANDIKEKYGELFSNMGKSLGGVFN